MLLQMAFASEPGAAKKTFKWALSRVRFHVPLELGTQMVVHPCDFEYDG